MSKKTFYVMDLFAGCGGLSLGLEQAGFVPVFVNELNDDARETYIQNREVDHPWLRDPGFHSSDVKGMVGDDTYLTELEKRLDKQFKLKHGELDLIVGGPPCQGFSGIGHRRSYSVEKEHLPSNHLFQDMVEIIRRLEPRAFLFENVRGLLNAKWNDSGRKIWPDVLSAFKSLDGYSLAYELVFAKSYGVPQNRPRVLLVGIRNDIKAKGLLPGNVEEGRAIERGYLPRGGVKPPDLIDLLGDLVDPEHSNGGDTSRYPNSARTPIQKMLRTPPDWKPGPASPKGSSLTEHQYSKHSERVIAKFKAMRANNGTIPANFKTKKFAQRLLPAHWGDEGPTITATSLADDYVHFSQNRVLTVREWARLQMFPDWYKFSGKRTTGGIRRAGNPREGIFDREVPKYTQIGNAVPVGLAKAVGEHLRKILAK